MLRRTKLTFCIYFPFFQIKIFAKIAIFSEIYMKSVCNGDHNELIVIFIWVRFIYLVNDLPSTNDVLFDDFLSFFSCLLFQYFLFLFVIAYIVANEKTNYQEKRETQ